MTSLFLNEVASARVVSLSKPWLAVVAALLLVASVAAASRESNFWIGGLVVAVGFAMAYLLSRRQVLSIASAGAAIETGLAGAADEVHAFIDQLEAAKNKRM